MSEDRDLELIKKSKIGDVKSQEILLKKYKNLVKSIANKYHIVGSDKDDILQEGMIGLYKAIQDFNLEGNVYFNIFAKKCITNQIISAVRFANKQKNFPLNNYISLDEINIDEIEKIEKNSILEDPETIFLKKENLIQFKERLKKYLTKREYLVLILFAKGYSYKEISNMLGITIRSATGSIQRAKFKLLTKSKKIL